MCTEIAEMRSREVEMRAEIAEMRSREAEMSAGRDEALRLTEEVTVRARVRSPPP